MRAVLLARSASDAELLIDKRLSAAVHFHLTGAGTASHADVLKGAAEARCLVALEMRQCYENIGVHDGTADLCFLHVFPVRNRDKRFIRTLQAVCNDDMAAGREGVVAVLIGGVQVIQRILAAPHIERIAVRQKWAAAVALHQVHDHLCVIGTQIGQVTRLAKMDFNRCKFILKIQLFNTSFYHQFLQLLQKVLV